MASRWTWSLTGVPSLYLSFGQSSVDSWGRPRACPPDTARRLMVRLSGLTRIWRGFCAVWHLPPSTSQTHRRVASLFCAATHWCEILPEEGCWILARNILDCALIDQFHQRHGESSGDASWWEVLSRFRVPSWLPLLSCHFGSSWSGQSVPIVQQECTDHKLILSYLSLISPLPYMSLCSTPRCE